MPFIHISLAGELTRDQKSSLCRDITDAVVANTGKPASSVLIMVQSEPRENWSREGQLLG